MENKKTIINFKEGILGFEGIEVYTLEEVDGELPFYYLSQKDGDTQFIVCDPVLLLKDYDIEYTKEIIEELEAEKDSDLKSLVIASIPDDFKEMTVNLMSPIIYNSANEKKSAKQFVLSDSGYPIRYKLFAQEGGE